MVAETLHAWRGKLILAVCVIIGSVLLVAGVYATSEIVSSHNGREAESVPAEAEVPTDDRSSEGTTALPDDPSSESENDGKKNTEEKAEITETKVEPDEKNSDSSEKSDPPDDADAEDVKDTADGKDAEKEPEKENESGKKEKETETEAETEPEPVYFNVEIRFADRETVWHQTTGETVRELLDEIGYSLDENHFLSNIGPDDYIWTDTVIEIGTIYHVTEVVTEYTAFNTVYVNSDDYPAGTTQITTEGVNGVVEATYTVEYVNGVETYRSRDAEKVVSEPSDQVVTVGTAVSQITEKEQGGVIYGSDGTEYHYSKVLTVRATYYNLPGNTATGVPVGDNVIAVDPAVIPLGTSVYLKNDAMDVGVRLAADTGVSGNTVDIWMNENSPLFSVFAPAGVWEMTCYILD